MIAFLIARMIQQLWRADWRWSNDLPANRGVAQMDESGGLLNLRPQVRALPPRLILRWIAQLRERLPAEQDVTVQARLQLLRIDCG